MWIWCHQRRLLRSKLFILICHYIIVHNQESCIKYSFYCLCTYVLAFRILSYGMFLHRWFRNNESVLHSTRSHIDFILQSRRLYCTAQRIYEAYHLVMMFLLKEVVYSLVCNKDAGLWNLSKAMFWQWNGSIWILSHVLFVTLYIIFIVYIM